MGGEAEVAVDDAAAEGFERRVEGDDAAAREADDANPLRVDSGMGREQAKRSQRAGDIGCRRQPELVSLRFLNAPAGEIVDDESGDAEGVEAV